MQVQSTTDAAKLVSSGVDDEALVNGGQRPRVGAGGLDAMAAMEAEALQAEAEAAAPGRAALPGFVSAGVIQQGQQQGKEVAAAAREAAARAALHNPEEIDIDGGDQNPEEVDIDGAEAAAGEGEVEVDRAEVQTKAVPAAVFGSLAAKVAEQQQEEAVGALDRFKKRRV